MAVVENGMTAQQVAFNLEGIKTRTILGDKLLNLARTAAAKDPNNLPPWLLPAAYANSTALSAGDVVLANGYWWVSQNAGTTSASGTGPNTPDIANVVTDGTVQFLLAEAPSATANDPLAPTVTRSTSAPTAPNNIAWGLTVSSASEMVRVYSGYQNPDNTDRYRIATFNRSASSTKRASGGRLGFWSDAAQITIQTPAVTGSEAGFRIIVDGRYLTPSAFNASVSTYTTINWGVRKSRFYEIVGMSREGFLNTVNTIYTTANDLIWLPSTGDDLRVYWISDSQSAGSGFSPWQPGGGVPFRVGRALGWNDVWNASIGGTGYINAGSGPYYTYGQRVAEGLTRDPDLWVFYGSTNDNGQSSTSITAAALAAFQAVRAGGSTAPIIVVGVVPISAGSATTETAIADAVTAFADPQTFFVPLCNASPYPAIVGSFNRPAAFPGALSTFARDINTTDGVHLMESALPKHSLFIAQQIREKVLPFIGTRA